METFTALLALCAGNSPVTGKFPSQVPVTRSFDVFLGPHLSGRLNTHSGRQWFQTASRSLWRHCSDDEAFHSADAVCGNSSPKVSQGVPHGLPIRGRSMWCLLWDTGVNKVLAFSLCIVFNIMSHPTAMKLRVYSIWFKMILSSCQWCVFRTADPVCRESAGHQWLPSQGTSIAGALIYSYIFALACCWINSKTAGEYQWMDDYTMGQKGWDDIYSGYMLKKILGHNITTKHWWDMSSLQQKSAVFQSHYTM